MVLFPNSMNFMLSSQYYLTERFKAATCIAVIDEASSPTATQLITDWSIFRSRWPLRPYYLLQIEEGCCGVDMKIPPDMQNEINTSPLTTAYLVADGNQLPRDDGNSALASDWFVLANCGSLQPEDNVLLFIDQSGSTTLANVRASYDLFLSKAATAGLNVWLVTNTGENYIDPFITWTGDQV